MKTILKISVLVLGLFISEMTYAGPNKPFEAEVVNAHSLRLEIKNVHRGVNLKLVDQQDQVIYNEAIWEQEEYHKILNLSSLPYGNYRLELEYPTRIQVLPIHIGKATLVLNESELVELFKPMVRQRDSKISITMMNIQKLPLRINFYDSGGDLIYHDESVNDFIIGKRYDLSKMDRGFYTISMSVGQRNFSQSIMLE